jgi:3-hydroxyacyl-[acyl-carrier-protein] dehydratase
VGVDNARFKKPVTPGDQLILNASIERFKAGIWKFKTFATVNDVIVTEADLMCTIRKKEA